MKGIAVYVEGGGDRSGTRRKFRQGMDVFLTEIKSAARARSWHWKLVACGGRDQTYKAFREACGNEDKTVVVLLVDSEGPVPENANSLVFLHSRDGWNMSGFDEEVVHLMVQSMETWIISDPDALERYYRRDFLRGALPGR